MTYILGAKCVDGVVLVGDLKQSNLDGSWAGLAPKIFQHKDALYAFSGRLGFCEGLHREFLKEVGDLPTRFARPILYDAWGRLRTEQPDESKYFQGLIAERIQASPTLWYIGLDEFREVPNYLPIGNGAIESFPILNRLVSPNLSIRQMARIGYFAIKIVERTNNFVGIGERRPQVYYLPNNQPEGNPSFGNDLSVQEASKGELDEMEVEVSQMLVNFDKNLGRAIEG